MNVDAANRHHGQIGGERLAVDLALAAAVERVTDDGAELLQIDVIDAVADLLIASETNADRAVRQLPDEPSDCAAASMMTATPALSSAPSSVVPSVVTIVLPFRFDQLRIVGRRE